MGQYLTRQKYLISGAVIALNSPPTDLVSFKLQIFLHKMCVPQQNVVRI